MVSITDKKKQNNSRGEIVQKLAAEIVKNDHFAQDQGGKLYRFNGGVYRRGGDEYVRRRVDVLLVEWKSNAEWSSRLASEVIELIRLRSPELWEQPPVDIVNLKNGLLDVRTRKLSLHSADHLSPIQLPVSYDPDATCPSIETFIADVFPPDAIDVAWELVGWLMVPETSLQKAVLLSGEGENGKSTFLSLCTSFIGKSNVTNKSLHQLELRAYPITLSV